MTLFPPVSPLLRKASAERSSQTRHKFFRIRNKGLFCSDNTFTSPKKTITQVKKVGKATKSGKSIVPVDPDDPYDSEFGSKKTWMQRRKKMLSLTPAAVVVGPVRSLAKAQDEISAKSKAKANQRHCQNETVFDVLTIIPKSGNKKKKFKVKKLKDLKSHLIAQAARAIRAKRICERLPERSRTDKDNPYYIFQVFKHVNLPIAKEPSELRKYKNANGVADSVLRYMSKHLSMASIQDVSCQILSHLITNEPQGLRKRIVLEHDAISTLIQCMEQHRGNSILQAKATMVLRKILMTPNGFSDTFIPMTEALTERLVQAVANAMLDHKDDPTIQANAYWLLKVAGDFYILTFKRLEAKDSAYRQVKYALQTFPTNVMVQIAATRLGDNLISLDSRHRRIVYGPERAQVMELILSKFCEHAQLQKWKKVAFQIIVWWAFDNKDLALAIFQRTAERSGAFLSALVRKDIPVWSNIHNRTRDRSLKMYHLLQTLLSTCKAKSIQENYKAITDYIVDGMQRYSGDTEMELEGCCALDVVADRCPEGRQYILRGDDKADKRSYGEADNALFALVQRTATTGDQLFHVAGTLMFKVRGLL